ncbi:tRNA (adenosine(37)-N6)-threonylcarbamoyltransferase complex ATPase subunit type 1 TsaE [Chlorobium sp. N1]|uniref:tRNA (adenosine(37)-N6)-threonylcarbamoyltransferase complex ATPase subunit type 1 TsaE n=1 Tax=Chlorobium sp. N1 TaxID=2491138 RepID=UPI00103EBC4C|nr:tRNA (adenosine(37)-N6)-threonylcarbamoyltransferase complex ATPase subunit type 1 TsaE [Chlorobium sp. N1]TCD48281.1 tRNA (adenosine(37)-N6)-threonylcarbamoyltransferase complex ATPase subunit type 1 TsaE [Chlorobium sp. N1]
MSEIIHSASAEETRAAGRRFASTLREGDVVALNGELGAGKTEFMRGVTEYFGCSEQLASPTFPLMNVYEGFLEGCELSLHHFDLYRLETDQELEGIGFGEYLSSAWASFVEWAERFPKYEHAYTSAVTIDYDGPERRIITVTRRDA